MSRTRSALLPLYAPLRQRMRTVSGRIPALLALLMIAVFAASPANPRATAAPPATTCARTLTANVVALDQPLVYNRLGASNPVGMIYALRRDVIDKSSGKTEAQGGTLAAGDVELRHDKRPRPLTLRMNVGDCLAISFQNLLNPTPLPAPAPIDIQPATRDAGISVVGMQLKNNITDDGSHVGANADGLLAPGDPPRTYTLYAEREGAYLLHNSGAPFGGEGGSGTVAFGLFGAVNVEPRGAEWYRSQLTAEEMQLATVGETDGDQPLIDYEAEYLAGHAQAGRKIIAILDGNEIVHSDLTAIITGPARGRFPAGSFPVNPAYPDREQPFREFTVIFHDENAMLQAFPEQFEGDELGFTLHGVRDGFAINYGSAGVGSEVLANRFGVGPAWDCAECKFEEFFLTSWANGDPAMVVDIPANRKDAGGDLITGPKATKALYPSDPSNVYHSYMSDHVKIRNLQVGKEHHIFHLHAHQWEFSPDDDNSTYLDSQAIGPGTSYTYDIAHNGSGNRNKTMGDSIFHCHFYPHFAQGMWGLWRVHDTFEAGTELAADPEDGLPLPVAGARALPDGEIAAGTPIPALVPIPTLPMAPMPLADVDIVNGQPDVKPLPDETAIGNPGYPFNIASGAGHRPATPPLDLDHDGGLKRHVVIGGQATGTESAYDFHKVINEAEVAYLAEGGEPVELAGMDFHDTRWHSTFTPENVPAQFETNGLPATPGAPFADPCRSDNGQPTGNARLYRAAMIQLDMTINKAGWHVPQARIEALWGDVAATLDGTRAPEPLVMRGNSQDCITFYHTNLLPDVYEQDAFQVKTPTDVVGQHIHLVKFDVTSSDGSGNGFNYEDGTFGPKETRERIKAIRAHTNALHAADPTAYPECVGDEVTGNFIDEFCPLAKPHPFFGAGPGDAYLGARTTVQRWYVDPVHNNRGQDRTLGTVFTHDHFSPSTHQQVGLYGTLLAEPEGSTWRHPETGVILGTRQDPLAGDGGPTSWWCDILTGGSASAADATSNAGEGSHREYYLEFQDFALAYEKGRGVNEQGKPIPDPLGAINPPVHREVPLPKMIAKADACPNGDAFADKGCPEAISANDPGTFIVNYRNEPMALRVRDPQSNGQAAGTAGDLSFGFASMRRADPDMNSQPASPPQLTADVDGTDPFTALLRAYDGDRIKIKAQVGGTEEGHILSVQGLKWLQESASPNSGWRNAQMMGLSEQFTLDVPIRIGGIRGTAVDYLYQMTASTEGTWNGDWGLLRAYDDARPDLLPLPNNPMPSGAAIEDALDALLGVCPLGSPMRNYNVVAVSARRALPDQAIVYNPRTGNGGPLKDPTAILYVRAEDLKFDGTLKPGVPIEPLILRANAGDCIRVTLSNRLPDPLTDTDGFNLLPPLVDGFNGNELTPSPYVGLRAQLVSYNNTRDGGWNVGRNPTQTVAPGSFLPAVYTWYAGDVRRDGMRLVYTPVEFGATNLMSSDPIKHASKGAIGALIIEPQGSKWEVDAQSRASATITKPDGSSFREFVMLFQDDVVMLDGSGTPLPFPGGEEDAEDSGMKALNYRTEPMWMRVPGLAPDSEDSETRDTDFKDAFTNALVGGDPVTPIFKAFAGQPVRFRLLEPGGHARNHVFALHGHVWQREPYTANSTVIGSNPASFWRGSQEGHGPANHFDAVPMNGAGGAFKVPGDYLWRDFTPLHLFNGIWGIFRVEPEPPPPAAQTVKVELIEYATRGGLLGNRDLVVNVKLVDSTGAAVPGASVSVQVKRNGVAVLTASGTTGATGIATFVLSQAQRGTYSTVVTAVTAAGTTWDGVTPANRFEKR